MATQASETLKKIEHGVLTLIFDIEKFYEKVHNIEDSWRKLLEKFKGLGTRRQIDESDQTKVIRLFDAKEVVESLRAETIAAKMKAIFSKVNEDFEVFLFLLHGDLTPEAKLTASLVPRGAQVFDRAQKTIQSIFQILDVVDNLLLTIGKFLDLLDVLKDAEAALDRKALPQSRKINYHSIRTQFQSRVKPVPFDGEIVKGNVQERLNESANRLKDLALKLQACEDGLPSGG